jgi:hypothetical protein
MMLEARSRDRTWLWAAVKSAMLSRQPMYWMHTTLADLLAAVPPLALTLLFLQALRRKLLRDYSVFLAYTALQIAKGIFYPAVYGHPKIYFVGYWVGELIDIPLVVAVLYQLYSRLFRGFDVLQRLQDLLFRWSAAICFLVAVVSAAAAPGGDADRVMAGLLALDLAAAVLKVGLIVFLLLMSSALCLRWTHYAFGILVGMGLYNSVALATVAARSEFGSVAAIPYALIKVAAYDCAIFVWLAYFLGREPAPYSATSVPTNDLASWNQALLELLTK